MQEEISEEGRYGESYLVIVCSECFMINIEHYSWKEIEKFKDRGYLLINNELYEICSDNTLLLKSAYEETPEGLVVDENADYEFVRVPNGLDRIGKKWFEALENKVDVPDRKPIKTYLMTDSNTGYTKIGASINPKIRERTLQSEKPTITLFAICEDMIESELHMKFYEKQIRGEWFDLSKKDIDNLIEIYKFKPL